MADIAEMALGVCRERCNRLQYQVWGYETRTKQVIKALGPYCDPSASDYGVKRMMDVVARLNEFSFTFDLRNPAARVAVQCYADELRAAGDKHGADEVELALDMVEQVLQQRG